MRVPSGAVLLASLLLSGQQPTFRSGTDAVRVDVLVYDKGRPVVGLSASDFLLTDNGVAQNVRLVETGDVPVAVCLVLDTSQSVAGPRLQALIEAASRLLDSLHSGDRATLITFDDGVQELVSNTTDIGSVRRALASVTAGGRTSLNDAAYTGLLRPSSLEGRRLMVLFSDGEDTESWLGRDAVLKVAEREETVVYGVTLRDRQAAGDEAAMRRSVVESLPATTGGQLLQADAARDLAALFTKVMTEFRQRYWLSYSPTRVPTGDGWHRLAVKVRDRNLRVVSRTGYYSNAAQR